MIGIDKKEAIKALDNHKKLICYGCVRPQKMGYCEEYCKLAQALDMAIKALEQDVPDFNVGNISSTPMEIVRCKHCKHRIDDDDFVDKHICLLRRENGGKFCKDDDFCSYGKKL